MESVQTVSQDAEGRSAYDADDNWIGMVARVEDDAMSIHPDPDLIDSVAAKLGWTSMVQGGETTYSVPTSDVESVRDDGIVVRRT